MAFALRRNAEAMMLKARVALIAVGTVALMAANAHAATRPRGSAVTGAAAMSRHIVAMILAALVAAPCSAAPGASGNPPDASVATHAPLTYNGQPISRWNAPGAATAGSANELSTVP